MSDGNPFEPPSVAQGQIRGVPENWDATFHVPDEPVVEEKSQVGDMVVFES